MDKSYKPITSMKEVPEQLRKLRRQYLRYQQAEIIYSSYKDKDGKTIYTTDVIVEEHEFAQNKDSGAGVDSSETSKTDKDGFMEASEGEIPFN